MNRVRVFPALVAGFLGTMMMSVVLYALPLVSMPEMDIVMLIGTMFTPDDSTLAGILGILLHFGIGMLFGLLYVWLWTRIGEPNWIWGAIFGGVHGIIVAILLPFWLGIHPNPLAAVPVTVLMVVGLILTHLVYGITVALGYKWARRDQAPIVVDEPVKQREQH